MAIPSTQLAFPANTCTMLLLLLLLLLLLPHSTFPFFLVKTKKNEKGRNVIWVKQRLGKERKRNGGNNSGQDRSREMLDQIGIRGPVSIATMVLATPSLMLLLNTTANKESISLFFFKYR